jgi:tetratricopeptide (TPR) repeat protein
MTNTHKINSALSYVLTCGLWLSLMSYAPTVHAVDEDESEAVLFTDYRDQGILYFKRKLYKQARNALEKARKMPKGKRDPKTAFYLAQSYAQLTMLKRAFALGEFALDYTLPNTKLGFRIRAFMDELSSQYGPVEIRSDSKSGFVYIDASSAFLNPRKRRVFESVRTRLRAQPLVFPAVMYLPFGRYTANRVPFVISGKQLDTASIYIRTQDDPSPAAGQSGSPLWYYVGASVAVAAAGVGTWFYLREDTKQEVAPNQYNLIILNPGDP